VSVSKKGRVEAAKKEVSRKKRMRKHTSGVAVHKFLHDPPKRDISQGPTVPEVAMREGGQWRTKKT
jgi:hypothetical protein